ncbi:MAG: hypothetical protein JOZ32_17900 [Bryobacterales bacterium]|nr:hypothetical protein [Bryobacterales bacterium]
MISTTLEQLLLSPVPIRLSRRDVDVADITPGGNRSMISFYRRPGVRRSDRKPTDKPQSANTKAQNSKKLYDLGLLISRKAGDRTDQRIQQQNNCPDSNPAYAGHLAQTPQTGEVHYARSNYVAAIYQDLKQGVMRLIETHLGVVTLRSKAHLKNPGSSEPLEQDALPRVQ